MTNRETLIAALAQTLAPRLFKLSGDVPEEMGFPIEETKELFEERMERQFNPIGFWTKKAEEIANSVVKIIEAGGVDLSTFDYDKAVDVVRQERPDLDE